MNVYRPLLERRVLAALDASPRRIPVLLGYCGSGRTSTLLRLRDQMGRTSCQYVDVERVATTPERFFQALRADSPFAPPAPAGAAASARDAFDAVVTFLTSARAQGGTPVTFLLDEVFELRTFESFPGLRTVLRDLVSGLASSQNRFVLTSRYSARAQRLLRDAPSAFEIVHVTPLSPAETQASLVGGSEAGNAIDEELARAIHALADGRPVYLRAIAAATDAMGRQGPADPVSALAELISTDGSLSATCRFCYELRLHRARGYGALKAILEVLASEEPLTLTEIAQRLHRTPGSTKDYLSWLEDVDLVESRQKRYRFADPLLRLWVRLHCRPTPVSEDDLAREVHAYAAARLPQGSAPPAPPEPAPAFAMAGAPSSDGIIEID
jgi:hypothetical protein